MVVLESRDVLSQYNKLYKETDEIYHSLARHYGLSDCAFWILYVLRESKYKTFTQKELCNELCISKQTVNSALKNFEADDLIRLEPSANDQRNKQILLTEKGTDFASQTVDHILQMDQNAFESFTPEERIAFMKLMHKYVAQLRNESEKILYAPADKQE